MRRVGRGLFRSIFETTISCLETKRTGLSSGLGRSVHLSETRTSKVIQLRQGLDPTSDLTHHSRRKGVILINTLAILNYLGARARAAPPKSTPMLIQEQCINRLHQLILTHRHT